MTSPLSSDFALEASSGDSLTAAIKKVRDRIKAATSAQLLRPESFGAVANSAAAATANRAALQAWLNAAANGGILYQDPNDVYYVQARPSAGANAALPLSIRYPSNIPFLRLRTKYGVAGPSQKILEIGATDSAVSHTLGNAAVTRGQYLWSLPDFPAAIPVGTKVLITAGENPYNAAANGLFLRAIVRAHDVTAGLVLVDKPAPRAFAACTASPAPKMTVLSNAADGSVIGLLDIDQTEHGNTALDMPLGLVSCEGVTIESYFSRGTTDRAMSFRAGATRNLVKAAHFSVDPSSPLSGSCGIYCVSERENKILSLNVRAPGPAVVLDRAEFCGHMSIHHFAAELTGTSSLWDDFELALMKNTGESEAASIGTLALEVKVDALGDGARTGVVVARNLTGAEPFQVGRLVCNKDIYRLGCKPEFLETKSIRGPRMQVEKELTTAARNAGSSGAVTAWLGSVFMDEFRYKYSRDAEADQAADPIFGISLHAASYIPAGSQTDSILHGYGAALAPGNQINAPANTWVDWQLFDRDVSNVADGQFYNNSSNGIDRFLRFNLPAVWPAMKLQVSYGGYPMRGLFTTDNT